MALPAQIAIVGGGPAGLVCARTFARHGCAVTVYERRAREDAPGLGITLPEEAREVIDLPLANTIGWRSCEVSVNRAAYRFPFAELVGIARAELIGQLARACEAEGVTLRYDAAIDPAALEADLVVGADGVDSAVRALADFGTEVIVGDNRFAWLGVGETVPEMQIGFTQTPHGMVLTSTYPFSTTRSTLIIEGSERAIGALDLAARFPRVDTPVRWRQFRQVSTRRLVHGRYALIGDAAGSIYYSFGAGTAMAVRAGTMLASAVVTASSLAAGLAAYEETFRPHLDAVQHAAGFDLRAMSRLDTIPPIANPQAFARGYVTRFG